MTIFFRFSFTYQGSYNCLLKVAEDDPTRLDCDIRGQSPLAYLIERFLIHTEDPSARFRVLALSCLKNYYTTKSAPIMANIDNILAALFRRASDTNSDVRAVVCQSLSILLNVRPDKLLPQIGTVAEYMIYSAQDSDEAVSLEASEFWLTFGEDPALADVLRPFLPQVGPLLLNGMVYSQSDLDWLGGDEDDENVPDRVEDIKPRHFGGKAHAQAHGTGNGTGIVGMEGQPVGDKEDGEDSEDDYDEDEDEDEDDLQGDWNLRKCSAAALDVMAVTFGEELLNVLLPHLRDKLFSQNWMDKESSILALGAIAEGE